PSSAIFDQDLSGTTGSGFTRASATYRRLELEQAATVGGCIGKRGSVSRVVGRFSTQVWT
ncbi:hypothetical protein, partial [Ferrimicrobium sp.]|uniref:hypothetical protein n=1 Tax=Ferrimicrobium sp. TaxID=2926050 RepID=UPI0026309F8D